MNDDLVPSAVFGKVRKWWWVLAGAMILGGIAGMVITKAHLPVFESNAAITTSIDFAYAGRITDEDEDYLILTIGDVLDSSLVWDEVISAATAKGENLYPEDIESNFSKSRQAYRWELSVRAHDPEQAQLLANIWVNAAANQLAAFREKSLTSLGNQTEQLALEKCFGDIVDIDPVSGLCSPDQISELRKKLQELDGEGFNPYEAILLSKISAQVTDEASLPYAPILFKQNVNVLMGTFIGFLAAFLFFIFWNPERK